MSRPIDGDGTSSCSTGALALEKAAAVGTPAAIPTNAGSTTAVANPAAKRINREPRVFTPKTIAAPIRRVPICGRYSGAGPIEGVFETARVRYLTGAHVNER